MKKFLILFVVMVYSCGNTSYFEDVGIPAREDKRGDYGIVNLDGDIVIDLQLWLKIGLILKTLTVVLIM